MLIIMMPDRKKGMDPIVGFVLVSIMVIAVTSIVSVTIRDQIRNIKLSMSFEKGKQQMVKIKDAIEELLVYGGSRVVEVDLDDGHIVFSSDDDTVYFSVPAGYRMFPSGYTKEENGLIITSGSGVEITDSGEIVVENEAIVATFMKAGTAQSGTVVDVRDILKRITVKKTGKTIYPSIDVVIGDRNQTFGRGYVYPVTTGYGKAMGRVVAKISSKDYNYTLLYIIPSGADYVIVKVRDIRKNS